MYYLDEKLENLYRIFDQNERKDYLRLDLNENPGGLPEGFVKTVLKDVTPQFVAQYPETLHFTEVLAGFLGTDIAHLCLVNGSAEGIRYIIQAFTSPEGRIVGVVPSYFMFQVYSEMYGRKFVKVPYNEDLSMDVNNIITELTDDTQLLILLNPNNPMGNVYSDEEFERILKVVQEKQINILIDEAYHYFYPKTFIKYALEGEHVFVTRTFSKLFSMAGCRLGYVAGWPEGVKMVQKMCTPHNTNAFAMMFAEAVLTTPGVLDSLINGFTKGEITISGWCVSRPSTSKPGLLSDNAGEMLSPAQLGQDLSLKPKDWVVFFCKFDIPAGIAEKGGYLCFRNMTGKASIYLNGELALERKTSTPGDVVLPLKDVSGTVEMNVLMQPDTKGHILLADIVYITLESLKSTKASAK